MRSFYLSIFHADFLPLYYREISSIDLAKTMASKHAKTDDDLWVIQDELNLIKEFGFVRDLPRVKCETCGGSGWEECYRDADEPCPNCEMGKVRYRECFGHDRPEKKEQPK